MTVSRDIRKAVNLLEKQRRDKISELISEYEETIYYPEIKKLRAQCESEIGHRFCLDEPGVGTAVWYTCSVCGARKVIVE